MKHGFHRLQLDSLYTTCVYIWYTYLAEVCVKTPDQQSSSTAPSDDQQACCTGRRACLDIGLAGLSLEAEEGQSDEKWQKRQEDQGRKVTDEQWRANRGHRQSIGTFSVYQCFFLICSSCTTRWFIQMDEWGQFPVSNERSLPGLI